jgi:hypothetical protein
MYALLHHRYANDLDVLFGLIFVSPYVLDLMYHIQPLRRSSEDRVLVIQPGLASTVSFTPDQKKKKKEANSLSSRL